MLASGMRLVVGLGLIGGLTVLGLQIEPADLADACDLLNFPQHLLTAADEEQRADRLAVRHEATLQCLLQKEQLARDVLAGRLSLGEAAARFRVLGQTVEYDWDHYRYTQPTWSEERRLWQYVIDQVEDVLLHQNVDPSAVVRKLTAEAEGHH